MKSSLLLNALAIFSLAACNSSSSGGGTSATPTTVAGTELQGTWVSACTVSTNETLTMKFTGDTLIATTADRSACTNSYSTFTVTQTISGGEAASAPAGAKHLDATLTALTVTPSDAANASALNAGSFCGFTDWVAAQPKSIVGVNCGGTTFNAGAKYFQVYKISGSNLQIGDDTGVNDGSTAQLRPTTLESDIYVKQ